MFCPGSGSRNETKFGTRTGFMNDLTEPCFVLGGVAQFPENADETPPRDLSGQFGHQLDFRPLRSRPQTTQPGVSSLKGPNNQRP